MIFPFQIRHRAEAKPSYPMTNKERRNSPLAPLPSYVANGDDAVNNEEKDSDAADVGDAEDDVERSLPRLA